MRAFGVLAAWCLATICAYLTYAALGLALIPQDSGADASGKWGYAVIPGVACLALVATGVALLRRR
jgi:hypothetical protein